MLRFKFFSKINPKDVAICTIHGNSPAYKGPFARNYSWPRLQIEQLRRYTPAGYTVYAYGNNLMPVHEAFLRGCPEVRFFSSKETRNGVFKHVWPLRNWLGRKAVLKHKYVVHLDSDAFPVCPDWLNIYSAMLSTRNPVVAVQRKENGDLHSDRSFLMYSREGFRQHAFDFSPVDQKDAGAGISEHLEHLGLSWTALKRSNQHDYHPLISGIYDDRIYHHAAGSREPIFRQNLSKCDDEDFFKREKQIHRLLMMRLFDETDNFLAELRGEKIPNDFHEKIVG